MAEQKGPGPSSLTKGREGENDDRPRTGRRLAESVSLGISSMVLLALAGYLLSQAVHPASPYVVADARPLLEQVRQEGAKYILPFEITNRGRRTLRDLTVEVRFRSPEGTPETRELQIDYLGERSKQTAYLYFDQDPRKLQVEASPEQYRVD